MLQLNQVQCFVELARELHFGRAAERLHMTQPPLSRAIQQLEWELGVILFERRQNAVALTAAGRAFLPKAVHLLDLADAMTSVARRSAGAAGAASIALIGYVPSAGFDFLPRVMAAVARSLPGIEMILHEMSTPEAIAALHAGRLDLAVVRAPAHFDGLHARCVVREPVVAAIPASHPLAARRRLAINDLHEQPFIMYSPGQGGYFYELATAAFHTSGIAPRYVQHVQKTHTILSLVGSGLGLALLPQATAAARFAGVTFRPIDLPAPIVSELHLAWPRGGRSAARHIEQLRELILDLPDAMPLPATE
ncbi:LysR family transcriptional regulator [Noviherbaspirillum aerium]|uniref:LysR family transcriptional regulator n=1 Tax=Noviherbaspirillum aerium TaxID=2588497 RepID=UPI00124E43BF|nr:LysR family transcriptional regulator [Noviherbaspirillum aerium]